jgi:NADPH:quinone reductase-like Zn-dependent oxidoreductase
MPLFPRPAGGYAEYVTAPARQFAAKPAALSVIEAGGLPLAGLTAWQAVVDTAQVTAGERVLVTAASGGVGHRAVAGRRGHRAAAGRRRPGTRDRRTLADHRQDRSCGGVKHLTTGARLPMGHS